MHSNAFFTASLKTEHRINNIYLYISNLTGNQLFMKYIVILIQFNFILFFETNLFTFYVTFFI